MKFRRPDGLIPAEWHNGRAESRQFHHRLQWEYAARERQNSDVVPDDTWLAEFSRWFQSKVKESFEKYE